MQNPPKRAEFRIVRGDGVTFAEGTGLPCGHGGCFRRRGKSVHHGAAPATEFKRRGVCLGADVTTRGANLKWKDFAVNRVTWPGTRLARSTPTTRTASPPISSPAMRRA